MTTLSEHFESRSFTLGRKQSSLELKIQLLDCPDQLAAEQKLWSDTPGLWPTDLKTLIKTSVAAKHVGGNIWDGTVTYGDPDAPQNQEKPKAGDIRVGYRISSANHKIKRSKKTVARYGPKGKDNAPDFRGAIGVESSKGKGKVEGTDVKVPTFQLVISGYFMRSQLTTAYRKKLAALAHTLNDKPFFGFERGELLFDGGHFDAKSTSPIAEVEFVWDHEPNVTETLHLVDANGEAQEVDVPKAGWDYLWVYYRPQEIEVQLTGFAEKQKFLIMQPAFAYVEQVYDYEDYKDLGLGIGA